LWCKQQNAFGLDQCDLLSKQLSKDLIVLWLENLSEASNFLATCRGGELMKLKGFAVAGIVASMTSGHQILKPVQILISFVRDT